MSSTKPKIVVKNVSKSFRIPVDHKNGIKQLILGVFKKKGKGYRRYLALDDVSFQVRDGEFLGIVGRNGSGKSTLLKLLAGVYVPDRGEISVAGRVTPFIELGVGFNPDLTGRENVFLNGALLGFSRTEMDQMYDDIVSFAELEDFMEERLKNFSSGMQVRLAFSIAVRAKTDILLIDEVLAVGDASFQRKCFDYFRSLKKEKRTVVFISHDMNAVSEYCDRVILIDNGNIAAEGAPGKIAQKYLQLFESNESETRSSDTQERWGEGSIRLINQTMTIDDEELVVRATYLAHVAVKDPIFGISIYNPMGQKMYESNTMWKNVKTPTVMKAGAKQQVIWRVGNIFTNGAHEVSLTAAGDRGGVIYDWLDGAGTFVIKKQEVTTALTLAKSSVKLVR